MRAELFGSFVPCSSAVRLGFNLALNLLKCNPLLKQNRGSFLVFLSLSFSKSSIPVAEEHLAFTQSLTSGPILLNEVQLTTVVLLW